MPNACFLGIPVFEHRYTCRIESGLVRFEPTVCRRGDRSQPHFVKIGLVGFEPTISWSRTRRDTKLRYSPK